MIGVSIQTNNYLMKCLAPFCLKWIQKSYSYLKRKVNFKLVSKPEQKSKGAAKKWQRKGDQVVHSCRHTSGQSLTQITGLESGI